MNFLRLSLLLSAFFLLGARCISAEEPVRVQGVAALTRLLKSVAPELKKAGIEIRVEEDCLNSQAAAALGAGEIDIALMSRALTVDEYAAFPQRNFEEHPIGAQAVALLVSASIWESGVRALSQEQIAAVYEGRITSWKQLGGEDRPLKFFEPAHGLGVWETFATWLYGDLRKAPAVPWELARDGADAQTTVEFHSGALTAAALRWADRKIAFPLAIADETGVAIDPSPANLRAKKYPLSRIATAVFNDKPTRNRRKLLEFLLSAKGQEAVAANDLLPLRVLQEP